MKNLLISTAVLTVGLTGCSVWPEAEVKPEPARIAELEIPAGLKAQRRPGQYDIPAVKVQGQRPEELDLRAPMQVLALSTNAHVEEDEKDVRVWFERNEYSGDLVPALRKNVIEFFSKEQIEYKELDANHWETGWVPQYRETGWWLWKGQELTQEARFAVSLEPKPHGRSSAMTSRLLELRYVDAEQKMTALSQRREEVNFLNRVVDHVAAVELVAIKEARAKLPQHTLVRGQAEDGSAVLATKQDIDTTWSQLEALFEFVSLSVTDMNQSDHVYYVKYTKPDVGFWGSIWGSGSENELPLVENGEYQFKLEKTMDGTVIQVLDHDGKPLSADTVDGVLTVFSRAITDNKIEL